MEGASGDDTEHHETHRSKKTPEKQSHVQSPDAPAKKKKLFQPLKSLKKLFTGRKRTKEKDEAVAPRARSAESVLLPDDPKSQLSKGLSMSDDSVFNPKEGSSSETTKSMESISRKEFKSELSKKLQHKRPRRGEDDDGLPGSPPAHITTADALTENGYKGDLSMNSDHSLGSMDSDVEEDFFRPMVSGSKISNKSAVDLDAIPQGSTTNLANPSAYHKMAVKPKKQGRPPGRATKSSRRATTPTSPTGAAKKVLPQVEEERAATPDEDYDMYSSNDELDEKTPDIEIEEPKVEVEETQVKHEKKTVVVEKRASDPIDEVVIIKKSPEKKPPSPEITETKKSDVVMRVKSGSVSDTSKRQTIASSAVETESTVFGERKKRSSVIMDGKNWEDLDKQKENKTQENQSVGGGGSGGGGSEFAKMFNKFQRKSVKESPAKAETDVNKNKESTSSTEKTTVVLKPVSKVDKKALTPSSVENTDSQKKMDLSNRPSISPKPKPAELEKKPTPKQAFIIEKSESPVLKKPTDKVVTVQKTSSFRNKPVDNQAPVVKKDEPKSESKTPEKEKTDVPKKEVKSSIKLESKEAKPVKTVTIQKSPTPVTRDNKATDAAKTKVDNETSPASFKRDSPVIKNRARSQTLPDNKPKETPPAASSPSVKRTASSVNPGKGSPRASVRKPEPLKDAGGGGGPSWMAMAKKKTAGWSEDKDKEIETKKDEPSNTQEAKSQKPEPSDSCKEEVKGSHRKSVMDIAKRFQKLQVS